jgi:hypothetical protein
MKKRTINKLQTLAGAFLFLVLIFVGKCHGQSIQYQIERVCIDKTCRTCKGYIAIHKENLYIKIDSVLNHLLVQKKFEHKQTAFYWLKEHTGRFQICDNIAYLEIYFAGCGWKSEMYYLKKEL